MELQEIIERYKNQLLNAIVILLALFVAFKLYSNQAQKVANLKAQKQIEEEKIGIFKEIQDNQKKLKIYKEYMDQKDISSIIDIISDLAKESSVDIASVKPIEEDSKEFYTIYPLQVRIISENYHNIGNFIAKLESNPAIFTVEMMNITVQSLYAEGDREILQAELEISTVLSKDGGL